MRGLCQHTDAILVNTDKAGLLVGKIGGWGGEAFKCVYHCCLLIEAGCVKCVRVNR